MSFPFETLSPLWLNTYLLPLPDTLPMPSGSTFIFQYDDRNTPYLLGGAPPPSKPIELLRSAATGTRDVALRLWLVPSHALSDQLAMRAAVAVAEAINEQRTVGGINLASVLDAKSSQKPSALITVAELTTFTTERFNSGGLDTDEGGHETEIEDLTDPLLRCINCVQHFVRAFRVGTGTMIEEATYQRLRPWVLVATQTVDENSPPNFQGVQYLNHENLSQRPPSVLSNEQLLQWQGSVQLLSAGDPATLYYERFLEARRTLSKNGDNSTTVINAALAAEVLLDGVLGLLLWESSGGAPRSDGPIERAVDALSKDLRPRLRSEYHPLIGGHWTPDSAGPLKLWDTIANIRGRVVHRGYRPTTDEASGALESTNQIAELLFDYLSAKARQFPRTALMIVSKDGLKVRGAWSRVQRFASDRAIEEPPWRDNYAAWRNRVDSARRGRERRA